MARRYVVLIILLAVVVVGLLAGYLVVWQATPQAHFTATIASNDKQIQVLLQSVDSDHDRRIAIVHLPPEIIVDGTHHINWGNGTIDSKELELGNHQFLGATNEVAPSSMGAHAWAFHLGSHHFSVSDTRVYIDGKVYDVDPSAPMLDVNLQSLPYTRP